MNLASPKVGDDAKIASYDLFRYILQHHLPDPSVTAGEPRIQIGKGGQHYEFLDEKPRNIAFAVSGHINISDKGEWVSQPVGSGGNSNGDGSGTAFPPKTSYVHVQSGYINGYPVKYDGNPVEYKPYEKNIDTELFSQKSAIGVALYVKRKKDEWLSNAEYRCEIKFHTITKLNMRNAKKVKNTQLYDPTWLWQGTKKQGGGLVRNDDKKPWVGDESIGRVLLSIITPPPNVMFIQVVSGNLNYGIYNTSYNTHKHTFWT